MKLRSLGILAAAVGAMIWGASAVNAGTLNIYVQEVGVDATPVLVGSGASFGSVSYSNNSYNGDFKITLLGSSSDNGASLSDLLSSTTSVQNLTGTTKTIILYASQNDYTLPSGTPLWPVGGVTPEQLAPWKAAGATGAGIGSQLFSPGIALDALAARARAYVDAWRAA